MSKVGKIELHLHYKRTMKKILSELRNELVLYRLEYKDNQHNTSINFVEICLALSEYAYYEDRKITDEEKHWFNGGIYIDYIFPSGNKFSKIADLYHQLCSEMETLNKTAK
jgi:hypothetical protein